MPKRLTETQSAARASARARGCPDPLRAYATHKAGAAARGIGWEFTFDTWWMIWEPYYHLRGRGKNGLCMAREGDVGPYSPDNVYLTTNLGNGRDRRRSPAWVQMRWQQTQEAAIRFARSGPKRARDKGELKSMLVRNASSESDKYACNRSEGDLKFQ